MKETSLATAATTSIACSIIIPTRDQLPFLRPCIDSILGSIADLDIEILIVNNDSKEPDTIAYLQALASNPVIRILDWDKPFNFSAINNFAVEQCAGDVVCFLNNDIEIVDRAWLDKLLPLARRDDVGAVGCLLKYPDSTIQHGGIALHQGAVAKHIAAHEPGDFFASRSITQPFAVDAVTAACLLMRRSLFLRAGGFNAANLPVAFNDVDLCLRLGEEGLPVLLHPDIDIIHHESVSRKSDDLPSNRPRAEKEHAYMQFRWQDRLAGQHYKAGLPAQLLREKAQPATIDEVIADAGRQLFLGDIQDPDSSLVAEIVEGTPADNWQTHYASLQADYASLLAHATRMEQAHRLIENSIFWRMTAPLRWLKDTLMPAGRHPPAIIQESTDTPQPVADTDPAVAPVSESDKSAYDRRAQQNLSTFLHSAQRLTFPVTDDYKISIILVFFNQAHLSLLCLQSILKHADVSYEIVIIDNASTDDTGALLATIENANIVRNQANVGFVEAVNQGARICRGEYLLVLNNDALIEAQTLSSALAVFDEEDAVGAVGAKIKLLDGSLQEAGSIIWNDGACLGYGRGAGAEQPEFMFRREVDYCSGAFLLFRQASFAALNGFDLAYAPAYYEESDFCIRLQKSGLRVIYNPRTQLTHYEFASSGGLQGASKLQAEHRQILCAKHGDYLAGKYPNDPANCLVARTNNRYPNVLIIDDRVPHPSLGAGYPRAAHMINELATMRLNLSFYPLLFPDDDWEATYQSLAPTVEVLLGHGKPRLQSFLESRKGYYQTILISRCHNMEYFNFVINLAPDVIDGVTIIYDAEAVTAPRDILREKILGRSVSEGAELAAIRKELELARVADTIVTVSSREANIYQQHNFSNTVIIGHTIVPQPTPRSHGERVGLLFVGALRDDGSPNVDSLLWFIINVLPLIRGRIPGTLLHVVGDNTADSLAAIECDNVRFHGRIESIEKFYDTCRVFIAPTRFAAGIPHKVHEAAAHGLPCVTTSLLAQQLSWQDERELLVADTAPDFAEQCVRLYQDGELWQRVREHGLDAITTDCSAENFRQQLARLFS